MSPTLLEATVVALSALLGSIPFGLINARVFRGQDIRSHGSGNIGATNVSRVLGFWPWGFVTFALDFGKGVFPVLISGEAGLRWISEVLGSNPPDGPVALPWFAGLATVAGHCYSPWLGFRGGKGVATGFGAIALLSPWAALGGVISFAAIFGSRRTASLASLTGLYGAAVTHLAMVGPRAEHLPGLAIAWIILTRHEGNMDALLDGSEKSFGPEREGA